MPTTYAHWHFGQECIDSMPDHLKNIVLDHREIFDLGVHGPDIFFYDLIHKELPAYGTKMHSDSAEPFFRHCAEIYHEKNEKDEMLAYILGFLSHFTLDSQCHGYIDRKKEVSGVSHNKIEAEYDGHLMRLDGRTVNLVDRSESLKPNKKIALIISYFFPYTNKEIYGTIRAQKLIINALNCVSNVKRNFFEKVLTQLNMNDYKDLIVPNEEFEPCKDSNLRLDKLRKNALALYPVLLNNLMNHINNNEELSDYFEHNYEPWDNYKSIPILSYDDELDYDI